MLVGVRSDQVSESSLEKNSSCCNWGRGGRVKNAKRDKIVKAGNKFDIE